MRSSGCEQIGQEIVMSVVLACNGIRHKLEFFIALRGQWLMNMQLVYIGEHP